MQNLNAEYHKDFKYIYFRKVYFCISRNIFIFINRTLNP